MWEDDSEEYKSDLFCVGRPVFPQKPSDGDQYVSPSGATYTYSEAPNKWTRDDWKPKIEERDSHCANGRPGVFISNTIPALVWVYEAATEEVGLRLRVDSEAYDINGGGPLSGLVAVFVYRCDREERLRLHDAIQRRLLSLTHEQCCGRVPSGPAVPSMVARRVLWQ